MKRFTISALLVVLVTIYVLCVSAYVVISAINGDDYFDKKVYPGYEVFTRVRRATLERNLTNKTYLSFNVCCDIYEYLNSNLECVKVTGTRDDKIVILSDYGVVDEDLNKSAIDLDRIRLNYKTGKLCPLDEMKVITWPQDQLYSYYISKANGHLLELSNDRKQIESNFSTASFCLDTMAGPDSSRTYVALLCLCKETVCVPKCCPKGYYHNTNTSSCKKESIDAVEPYKPVFPEGVPYHLVYNIPDCMGPDSIIIGGEEKSFVIMDNGQLSTPSKKKINIDRKKYCVDIFSNGNRNLSSVNGFYCPNELSPVDEMVLIPQDVKEVKIVPINTANCVNLEIVCIVLCFLFPIL